MSEPLTAFGITSKCEDNNHIYMGDIDNTDISLNKVKGICMELQKEFNLSTIYIVSSKNGFNLFSLDKIPLKMVFLVNNSNGFIDKTYNKLQFLNRGSYTLRTLPAYDKFIAGIVQSGNRVFPRSDAHRCFFNNLFGNNIEKDFMFDDLEKIELCKFHNSKYGWVLNECEQ